MGAPLHLRIDGDLSSRVHGGAIMPSSAAKYKRIGAILPLRDAGEPQPFHIVFAVALVFDGINLCEPLHGEIGLERQQLVDVRLRLLRPPEMPERGNQRLVAVDEIWTDFYDPAAGFNGFLVVARERVREGVNILSPN